VADDLDRKAVVLIAVGHWCVHVPSMAHQVAAGQARSRSWQYPCKAVSGTERSGLPPQHSGRRCGSDLLL
jgi:hypothetical protein